MAGIQSYGDGGIDDEREDSGEMEPETTLGGKLAELLLRIDLWYIVKFPAAVIKNGLAATTVNKRTHKVKRG